MRFNNKKYIIIFFVSFVFIFSIKLLITDNKSNNILNNNSNNITIISLSPSVTKKIIELNGTNHLIGKTNYCNYDEVKNINVVSDMVNINIDKIVSLKPTYVISEYPIDKKYELILNKHNIKYIFFETPKTIDEIVNNTELISNILNNKNMFSKLNNEFHIKNIDKYKNNKVYYIVATGSVEITSGNNTYINDFIYMIGAKNITSNINGWTYSKEQILKNNPDYIMGSKYNIEQFEKNEIFKTITAVKKKNYIFIDGEKMSIPSMTNILEIYNSIK